MWRQQATIFPAGLLDENYERYLNAVLVFLTTHHQGQTTIFLGGGRTNLNYSDRSETGELAKRIRQYGLNGLELVIMDRTYDAQDNLVELANLRSRLVYKDKIIALVPDG